MDDIDMQNCESMLINTSYWQELHKLSPSFPPSLLLYPPQLVLKRQSKYI